MDPTAATDPALLVSDLQFSHRPADAWSLTIRRLELPRQGQMLLTGGSGQGKSTLLQIISGLLDPRAGSVRVAGQDVHALRGPRRDLFRGRHIGMIFQTFHLLHGFTAQENVLAGMMFTGLSARNRLKRASHLLDHLGIDRPRALPDELSVGQQQRVAVARAVACRPVLVLADEPTASLDPQAADVAIRLIQDSCRQCGAALLCTSHDPAMASRFDRRAALEDLLAPAPHPAEADR